MNCPACDFGKNKVVATVRWPSSDTRKHKCLKCGFEWNSIAMNISHEALLEAGAFITRERFGEKVTAKAAKIHAPHTNK